MKETNLKKIKKADIVVGIPSYNESDTIGNVVKQIDRGLKKYFKNKKTVIINVDNNSPDDTKKVFLKTKTETPKIYITTPENILGKGNNILNLLKKMEELKAEAGMMIDADIKNCSPEWVKCLLSPVLSGNDFVAPIYNRNEYDGSITNNICYPSLFGFLGVNIRQPIGGDMGFSKKLCEHWLKQKWTTQTKQYGIDIFMTTQAIKGGFKICQSNLGVKSHKPSAPKLGPMFLQVTDTLFKGLVENKKLWQKKISKITIPTVCEIKKTTSPQKMAIDYKFLKERAVFEFSLHYETLEKYLLPENYKKIEKMFFDDKVLNVNANLWVKIIYDMFFAYDTSRQKQKIIRALRSLYFARIVSFIKQTLEKNYEESEYLIRKQAHLFYKNRNYLLKKYK
ncbi:MAG: glycosyltransferase [Candidatus Marinimicrobia bacterium]|nr:glycosyltransferase [Candidatus Neomarinimicrobiota bacterium]